MDKTKESCRDFIDALASSQPTPGGGGAAALVGAIGTALGNMVGSLTVGKQKYADVHQDMERLIVRCKDLEDELLNQVEADEINFLPLSDAYRIPKDYPNRDEILEKASVNACTVPLRIMELCCEAIDTVKEFAHKGNKSAESDAACAAVCLKAALQCASLNVFINTKTLINKEEADYINSKCKKFLEYTIVCDEIYEEINNSFFE